MNQKPSETGWFYHAPAKRQVHLEEELPPASQIPGLSDLPEEEQPQKQMVYRDSDTKYIRLCKRGGREDLLRFRDFKPKSKDPVPYPRNEWFYWDNNEEEVPSQTFEHKLPEYMVHEEYKPEGDHYDYEKNRPKRLPYAFDRLTVYEREGDDKRVTNKNVKIPEVKRPGYGVRLQRVAPAGPKTKAVHKSKPRPGELEQHRNFLPMPDLETEKPQMGKILSYTYNKEWKTENIKWHDKQEKLHGKNAFPSKQSKEPVKSEYQQTYSQTAKDSKHKVARKSIEHTPRRKSEDKEKPLFKLTRFTKVPARTDNHWHKTEQLPSVAC
ncbi:uncharacterized protein C7orf57 homolog [Lingula anatina]|uniref:Uncharacterized protein C7orf57 homolog n=1 Tax=Lingula anatina TaxID=7574 RepID=A0A1S3HCD8_LINAN|nr:uncharacterized protein C7orf57 homolog [Lingula anatina]|eukprot:XP_013383678.1 uncharacterized protein C7orf57 homolog [Lingula anatina]